MTESLQLDWLGPFSWPSFEAATGLPPLPELSGVYIFTFQDGAEFVGYGAGVTGRPFRKRFAEHTRKYLNGEYTVLDVSAAQKGIRKEIWHGWGYAREHREEFEERRAEITNAANAQLAAFRTFVAGPLAERRIRERIEAKVMHLLYDQPPPASELPDRCMYLSKRRANESPITVSSRCEFLLRGIPAEFAI